MINAILMKDAGALLLDLPRSSYDLCEKLSSIGICVPPQEIPLTDGEEDPVRVKLFSDNELGSHLIRVLHETDSLRDANTLAYAVQTLPEELRPQVHQQILSDQYDSIQDAVDDIHRILTESGPIKQVYYCPLTGNIDEGDGNLFTVGNSYLRDYAWAIHEALEQERQQDVRDIACWFQEDRILREKLVSIRWNVEEYRHRLFGRIECSLKQEMTEQEDGILREWITGQNSDGWGEHFEQCPLDTEDGQLYVSFWHGGNDYAILTHDELDAYIENQGMKMGGM